MADAANSEIRNADFETAIAECGFGLFNVLILLCAIPCLSAMVFSASAMSYVMPSAECELKLTLLDKGMMNAVTYAGMVISAVPWGFVADTMGRRMVIISGGWIDAICVLGASLSQNSRQLMVLKFFDGLVICGPFAVIVSYLAEFHGKKHRPYIMIFVGLSIAIGALTLPVMAYFLLPLHIPWNIGTIRFHTWQLFLALTAVPSLLSGLLHIFLPESPKFLMSHGNYNKALASLRRVYALNKRKSRDSYPIKTLIDTTPERPDEVIDPSIKVSIAERFKLSRQKFVDGLKQLKPLCASPYLGLSIRIYCLHFCQIMCVNTVRLWLPQIFAAMHTLAVMGISDKSMCSLLDYTTRGMNGTAGTLDCVISKDPDTYTDNIIVAIVGLVGFIIIFPLLGIRYVANNILKYSLFICTFLVGALYFSMSSNTTLILASIYLAIMGICSSTVIGMCVIMFPTLMRTMVLLLIMTFGRFGSVAGNVLLPVFMQISCWAPFLYLTTLMAVAFVFSLFLKIDFQQALN